MTNQIWLASRKFDMAFRLLNGLAVIPGRPDMGPAELAREAFTLVDAFCNVAEQRGDLVIRPAD